MVDGDCNDNDVGANNGLSTAMSYYVLHRNEMNDNEINSEQSIQKVFESMINEERTSSEEEVESSEKFRPWREDNWTFICMHNAEKKLQENKKECSELSPKCSNSVMIDKMEHLAHRKWDLFYKRNSNNFYKNRHYMEKAFPLEFNDDLYVSNKVLVEIGSGSGANVLPLLEKTLLTVHCYDFSRVAVNLLNDNPTFQKASEEGRASARVWDITMPYEEIEGDDGITIDKNPGADIVMLLFCLSAISPHKMLQAVRNVASTLKPGGILIFRDYGRYDEAQMKLGSSKGKHISDNFYLKGDGTRCYYFDLEDVCVLFSGEQGSGLKILQLEYIQRLYLNRATKLHRRRVWVQGRFQKPL